ncbi:hypothetical protein ABZ686_28330, partial [Streptomyces sp. NPDC006992]|uniref:hypothetical protein n=1 Tax=Streptomyces sp. NPDC006992 TaxID=3155601 RepID=UPI0033E523C1
MPCPGGEPDISRRPGRRTGRLARYGVNALRARRRPLGAALSAADFPRPGAAPPRTRPGRRQLSGRAAL